MKTKQSVAITLLTGLALAAGFTSTSRAAVVVVLPTASVAGKIEFTQDISFVITVAATTIRSIFFDEWVTNDGSNDQFFGGFSPSVLSYSLNGIAGSASITGFADNANMLFGSATPNDGYFHMLGPAVAVGDVFTFKAATYTLPAGSLPAGFNPQTAQTFIGNMFVTDGNADSISGPPSSGVVPEPSAALLGAIGALGLLRRRRVA